MTRREPRRPPPAARQCGVVLAATLLLLTVVSLLGVAAMVTGALELTMSANLEYQSRAFAAAEYAVEEALHSPDRATTYTLASPRVVPASGPDPTVPGTADTWRYRLYFDEGAGTTSVPDAAAVGPGVAALHFVIEATGRSARGAEDVHVQSFYLLLPEACVAGGAGCPALGAYAPLRSGWRQRDAE